MGKRVPTGQRGGRPKRSQVDTIIQGLSNHFTVDKMIKDLDEALKLAKEQNSSRGIVNVWNFIADRTMGLPVKTVIHSEDGYDKLFALVEQLRLENDSGDDEPGVIVLENPPKKLENKLEKPQE